jgi:hypothetical protein
MSGCFNGIPINVSGIPGPPGPLDKPVGKAQGKIYPLVGGKDKLSPGLQKEPSEHLSGILKPLDEMIIQEVRDNQGTYFKGDPKIKEPEKGVMRGKPSGNDQPGMGIRYHRSIEINIGAIGNLLVALLTNTGKFHIIQRGIEA